MSTDLFYWGGPVMSTQADKVGWERPTAILSYGRDGSDANAALYQQLSAADGHAWEQMARKAKLDPSEVGALGIGGFSAFHGFANNFLKNDVDRERTSYVHLADACFEGRGATEPFQGYLKYALEAATGAGKLMTVTTNGPWDQPLHYCYDYGPPRGNVCYDVTSGAQCFRLVWDAVLQALGPAAQASVVTPQIPPGVPEPDRAFQLGNLLWFHYEPKTGDSHGMHANVLATPFMQFFGAPWMAHGVYPGMPLSSAAGPASKVAGPLIAVGVGAVALLAAYLYKRSRRNG